MRVGVLGPLQLDGGAPGLAPRDRTVLAVLTLHLGEAVRVDTLAEALWGELPPPSAPKVVQGCVLRLRRALGAEAVETVAGGYRLSLHRDDVDSALADDSTRRARELLARGEPDRAGYLVDRARALFRGEPYPDLVDWEPSAAERERLVELHRDLEELCAAVLLETGAHEEAVPTLRALVAEAPTREHRWELLALAEYRSGRQAEALETTRRARRLLDEELGLEAGHALVALEAAVLRQDPALDRPDTVMASARCPYPGLLPYEVADSEAFFGREDEVDAALRTLDRARVVTLAGPSGCGKSSLLRAGVAAALARDGRPVLVATPSAWPSLVDLAPSGLLVVDQLEELFDVEPPVQELVVGAMHQHLRGGGLLALGIRADRMGELATFPEVARYVESGLHLLGGMTEADLHRAIVGPAEQAGLRLEPGLVDLVTIEVLGEPAALPLMSHVLRETWAVREGRTLTVAGYHSTGGVREAVSRSAESVYEGLDEAERALLKQLMTRLVTTGDEGLPTRRRVSVSSIPDDVRSGDLVERLIAARLLTSDGRGVEIAHESLTQAWPRLRSWLDEDVEGQQVMRHLAIATESWDQAGRPDSELYRGQREARATAWRAARHPHLTAAERDFLDASATLARTEKDAAEAQARRDRIANRRLRIGIAVVLVLALVATVAGAIAATSARRTAQALVVADARRLGSEALRAKDLDTSLLYAVAAMRLDDSIDTRSDLLAAIDRAPSLLTMTRTPAAASVAVSGDGGLLLVPSTERPMRVLDAATLETVREVPEVVGGTVVAAPDGSFAVAAISPALTRMGRAPLVLLDDSGRPSGRQLGGAPEGTYTFTEVTISPDSRHVAAFLRADAGGPVIGVWDQRAPDEPVALLPGDEWYAPLVDGTGRRVFAVGDRGLGVLDIASGRELAVLSPDDLRVSTVEPALALSPDGRVLAVGAGADVLLLDARTMERRGLVTADGPAERLTFSPSGSLLAVSGEDMTVLDVTHAGDAVRVFQQHTGRPNDWVARAGFSPDEATLYTSDAAGSVRAWDLGSGRGFLSAHRAPGLVGVAAGAGRVSADGSTVLHCSWAPGLVVEDLVDGSTSSFVDAGMDINGSFDCAISPDGGLVTVTTSDPRVAVWDSEGRLVAARSLPTGEGASVSSFTDDGALVVGTTTGRVHVFDARTLEYRRAPIDATPGETVFGFAVRPGGKEVLVLTGEGTVVDLVSGATSQSGLRLDGFSAAYSPDGTRLAVTASGGSVGLWDVEEGRWVSPPTDAAPIGGWLPVFSPDGAEFALAGGNRIGRWDGRSGAFLGAVTLGHDAGPGYARDGEDLVLAGADGWIYTWDLDPESWVAAACRMAGRDLTVQEWEAQMPDRPQEPLCPDTGT